MFIYCVWIQYGVVIAKRSIQVSFRMISNMDACILQQTPDKKNDGNSWVPCTRQHPLYLLKT